MKTFDEAISIFSIELPPDTPEDEVLKRARILGDRLRPATDELDEEVQHNDKANQLLVGIVHHFAGSLLSSTTVGEVSHLLLSLSLTAFLHGLRVGIEMEKQPLKEPEE